MDAECEDAGAPEQRSVSAVEATMDGSRDASVTVAAE